MRHVVAIRDLEDCFDGSLVREYEVDEPLSEDAMRGLASGCHLQYFADLPRPYFRIRKPSAWVIQGVLGEPLLRVTFARGVASADVDGLAHALERA